MRLLQWLFSGSRSRWHPSEAGNPTMVMDGLQLTVFASDGGHKFCIAKANVEDDTPHFSDPFATQQKAKDAALAWIGGYDNPHTSLTEQWRAERQSRARSHLSEVGLRLDALERSASQASTAAALIKIELKTSSTARGLSNQRSRALHDDLTNEDLDELLRLSLQASQLLEAVQRRIADLPHA